LTPTVDNQPLEDLTLYVVVRDGRGGLDWFTQPVKLQ
jgi:hypothetical protein